MSAGNKNEYKVCLKGKGWMRCLTYEVKEVCTRKQYYSLYISIYSKICLRQKINPDFAAYISFPIWIKFEIFNAQLTNEITESILIQSKHIDK